VYFPTLMLTPLVEDLHRRARCAGPHPFQPARARGRRIRLRGSRARAALHACPAVSACTAGAGPAGARS
jgi:hypothetical protein